MMTKTIPPETSQAPGPHDRNPSGVLTTPTAMAVTTPMTPHATTGAEKGAVTASAVIITPVIGNRTKAPAIHMGTVADISPDTAKRAVSNGDATDIGP